MPLDFSDPVPRKLGRPEPETHRQRIIRGLREQGGRWNLDASWGFQRKKIEEYKDEIVKTEKKNKAQFGTLPPGMTYLTRSEAFSVAQTIDKGNSGTLWGRNPIVVVRPRDWAKREQVIEVYDGKHRMALKLSDSELESTTVPLVDLVEYSVNQLITTLAREITVKTAHVGIQREPFKMSDAEWQPSPLKEAALERYKAIKDNQ